MRASPSFLHVPHHCKSIILLLFGAMLWISSPVVRAQQGISDVIVTLKNGMEYGPGIYSEIRSVNTAQKSGGNEGGLTIARLDDGLRIVHFHVRQLFGAPADSSEDQSIKIDLPNERLAVTKSDLRVRGVSEAVYVEPFDNFGRRVYSLQLPGRRADVVQGITRITPGYVRVEGLRGVQDYVWDTRLALSAVPAERLRAILVQNAETAQDWLDIVDLFEAAGRYSEAKSILSEAIQRFPQLENFRSELTVIDQKTAEQMFDEVLLRQNAGQHGLARQMLTSFPLQTLSLESRIKVQDRVETLNSEEQTRAKTIARLKDLLSKIPDQNLRTDLQPTFEEIESNLSANTANRLVDFERLADDESLTVDQRAALGFGGWLLGSGTGQSNIATVRAAAKARNLIENYLRSDNVNERTEIVAELQKSEAGTPTIVAQILSQMPPPLPLEGVSEIPGRYILETPLGPEFGSDTVRYTLQLPPEYDRHRKYPCIVALRNTRADMESTVRWWCGPYNETFKMCLGEASRHGYIVIVPEWQNHHWNNYHFTEDEQARILSPLRDAMRRTGIDSDRIFVGGHYAGATAAWDIAMARPDLFAGMVSIGGEKGKISNQYRPNARYTPSYFVIGEFDGEPAPLARNGDILDDYLSASRNDCTLIIYRGRGNDHFQEELPNLIQWMNLSSHKRNRAPESFETRAVRPGDRSFWWLEVNQYQDNKTAHPLLPWTKKEIADRTITINALRNKNNGFVIKSLPAESFTIWLHPDFVDFSQRISVKSPKGNRRESITPSIEVILEDVRQRADRQYPFFAKIDIN